MVDGGRKAPIWIINLFSSSLQEFTLLRLDDVADQRVNILGFSVFNGTHPFFQEFVLSLNRSWQENCDHAPFAGTPVLSGPSWSQLPHQGSSI
nr:glutamate receptor ionotropic, kainate 4-like [Nothobranchius furzeri]